MKTGIIAIVGMPNAGKSTLLNKMVGYKVSIATPKPQTTRYNINGIITTDKYQMVFVDTPGFLKKQDKLSKYMSKNIQNALKSVDIVIFLLDLVKEKKYDYEISDKNKEILQSIKKSGKKAIICLSKAELAKDKDILLCIQKLDKYLQTLDLKYIDILPISSLKTKNIDKLTNVIYDNLKEQELIYEEDYITDLTQREIVEEKVREKMLKYLMEEIPHGVNVIVNSFKEETDDNKNLVIKIELDILCKKDTHKAIIIGKDGKMLDKIIYEAKKDLQDFLEAKIKIKAHVKVRKNWDENDNFLNNIRR